MLSWLDRYSIEPNTPRCRETTANHVKTPLAIPEYGGHSLLASTYEVWTGWSLYSRPEWKGYIRSSKRASAKIEIDAIGSINITQQHPKPASCRRRAIDSKRTILFSSKENPRTSPLT